MACSRVNFIFTFSSDNVGGPLGLKTFVTACPVFKYNKISLFTTEENHEKFHSVQQRVQAGKSQLCNSYLRDEANAEKTCCSAAIVKRGQDRTVCNLVMQRAILATCVSDRTVPTTQTVMIAQYRPHKQS